MLLLNPKSAKKNITLKTAFPLNIAHIYADSDRITQVFTNLIGNAVKFTPSKGRIVISIQEERDMLKVAIKDTGKGIAPENFNKIFEKFKQVDQTSDSFIRGAGLGLPITKEIIQLHEGEIQVESQLGKGSKFTFTLPKYKPASLFPKIPSPSFESDIEETKQVKKILLIDDEPALIKSLQIRLENDNYNVLSACNGTEGLIKAKNEVPDLIILDVLMPGMNGYEVCRKLGEEERTHSIPIVMLTALGQIKDKLTGYTSGASEYVVKPFDYEVLSQKIKKILNIN